MPQQPKDDELSVKAYSPFHIFYEGTAQIVSALNEVGPFDVLPGHTGFFSILTTGEIIIDTGGDIVSFNISNGILSVRQNVVEIFVNI